MAEFLQKVQETEDQIQALKGVLESFEQADEKARELADGDEDRLRELLMLAARNHDQTKLQLEEAEKELSQTLKEIGAKIVKTLHPYFLRIDRKDDEQRKELFQLEENPELLNEVLKKIQATLTFDLEDVQSQKAAEALSGLEEIKDKYPETAQQVIRDLATKTLEPPKNGKKTKKSKS